MTNDTRSPKEIEREIEEQRSDLTSNLEDLQDKFSIDTVVRQIGDQFREHGGDMGRSISEQVKANPIPLALTGIGLAWMMFGNAQKPATKSPSYDDDGYSSVERDFRRRQLAEGRPYTPPTRYPSQHDNTPSWARDDHEDDGPSMGERISAGVDSVKDKAAQASDAVKSGASATAHGASSAGSSIAEGAARAGSSVAGAASSAGSSVAGAASSAGSTIASGARSARDGIAAAGSRIAEGTETMSEEARKRVIAARWKAIEMRNSASQSIDQGTDAVADFYDRQPLVVGALALAVGAALGGAMPRTKTEDDMMGAQSDNLFDQAERIFEEEKAKAMSVAKSVKDEVKDIAAETKADLDSGAPGEKSAVEAVGDKAKSAAKRVSDKAQSTAKDENLGKPKT
ncbi:DUF3618 domain-containing protein [Sedimentitalea todarodis]|uniref:DUF3618 domain-containing protein n=1 Tax=Sedimentitalea todarodis TaxID=1631240 RepID=A0ABU3VKP8_9RHOB|nr:DUF3618 domain-containing protein [Sedimentitalea todarodis]MDU9006771.1 DUF3618 domain-containing protein [Sedimentitalea todarodis]